MFNISFITKKHWDSAVNVVEKITKNDHSRDINLFLLRYFTEIDKVIGKKDKIYEMLILNEFHYLCPQHCFSDKVDVTKDLSEFREYRFFSFWGLVTYYAYSMYLYDCYNHFNSKVLKTSSKVLAISPSDFFDKDGLIDIRDDYKENYNEFIKTIESEVKQGVIVLKLDVKRYFNSIQHTKLIDKIIKATMPSFASINLLNEKRSSLIFYLDSLVSSGLGIPQGRKNLASNFIGNLYLKFLDMEIDSLCASEILKLNKYVRYMDDIYLFFDVKQNDKPHLKEVAIIEQRISYWLHEELDLSLNHSKTLIEVFKDAKAIADFLEKFKEINSRLPTGSKIEVVFEEYISTLKKLNFNGLKSSNFIIGPKERSVLKNVFKKDFYNYIKSKITELKVASENIDFEITIPSLDVLSPLFFYKITDEVAGEEYAEFPLNQNFESFISDISDHGLINKSHIEALLEWKIQGENDKLLDKEITRLYKLLLNDNLGKYLLFINNTGPSKQVPSYSKECFAYNLCKNHHIYKDSFSNLRDVIAISISNETSREQFKPIINQMSLFIQSFNSNQFSVALNHFHSFMEEILCRHLSIADVSSVNMNQIYKTLTEKNDLFHPNHQLILSRFSDRRNFNPVSHPSKKGVMAKIVTEEEIQDLVESVAKVLVGINVIKILP